MQSVQPYENAFVHKDIISFVNRDSLQIEEIKTYLKTNFNYTPNNDTHRTLLVKGDLYFLGIVDNLFVCMPITKPTSDSLSFLNTLCEIIVLMIKRKYALYNIANFISFKLCCYVELDKRVPFGFVKQSESVVTTDLFGSPLLQPNLTLYTKAFQFDQQYNVLPVAWETIMEKISQQPTFAQPTFSQPTFSQPTFSQPTFSQPTFSQPTFSQPTFAQASIAPNSFTKSHPFGK